MSEPPLLRVRDLRVSFTLRDGTRFVAVDGIDLAVDAGRTLALVGESGCGKTVTALTLLGLIERPPGVVESGTAELQGEDLLRMSPRRLRSVRGGRIAMIFQEPTTALDPVVRVGAQVAEVVRLHRGLRGARARAAVLDALAEAGLPDPARVASAYPHELSGGMCQRAMIAMAMAGRPRLLVADEPTTALDAAVRLEILELIDRLRRDRGMGAILVTHDLALVREHADHVAVMHGGRVLEYGRVADVFRSPWHPYTRGLFAARPDPAHPRLRLRTVGETVGDASEYGRMPGAAYGVEPWWPERPAPAGLADDGPPHALHAAEPAHWVRCWRTRYVAEHPSGSPVDPVPSRA